MTLPDLRRALAALAVLLHPAAALAQEPPHAVAGTSVTLQAPISSGDRPGQTVRYRVTLAPGVFSAAGRSLEGSAGGHARVEVPVTVSLSAALAPGLVHAASVHRAWENGTTDSLPLYVMVEPAVQAATTGGRLAPVDRPRQAAAVQSDEEGQEGASIQFGGLTKEVEVELYGSTRAAQPGGVAVLRFTLNSYEDTDERLRLRVHVPSGWTVLDRQVEEREFLLEAWEYLEGEIRVQVPSDVAPGSRHRVRIVAEVAGEPGGAAVHWPVQVVRRGGLRPGAVGLTGTAAVSATNLQQDAVEAGRVASSVTLSGNLARGTTASFNYRSGPRESVLTNFRIPQEETRWSGLVRGRDWSFEFGNQIGSGGGAVAGPYVRGQGVSLRRTEGLVAGYLTLLEPTSYVGDPGGLLARGSLGVGGRHGRLSATYSDFDRPGGGYSTAPRYPEDIDPDSLERLERERLALARASRNRVQAAGAELELTPNRHHRLLVRGGRLNLFNADGDTVRGEGAEAYYTFSHRLASLNLGWRDMPRSLDGVLLAGDQASVDASLKLIGELRVAGRGYRTLTETEGDSYRSEAEGASAGLRYYRQRWRMDLRGNYREWSYGGPATIARTASLTFGAPLGPLALSGYVEQGVQTRDTLRSGSASYRGDLRWQGRAGFLSMGGSYYRTLTSEPRLRADLLGSARFGAWELAGGAWATRGWIAGGEPGVWTQVGVPLTYDLLLTLGAEHAPEEFGRDPVWLGTVGIRKSLTLPIPFLRDPSTRGVDPITPPAPVQ